METPCETSCPVLVLGLVVEDRPTENNRPARLNATMVSLTLFAYSLFHTSATARGLTGMDTRN